MNDEKIFLESQCVEQSWIYHTTDSKYVYLLSWTQGWGFRLKRRSKSDGWPDHRDFWNRNAGENWIQLNDGQFDPAYCARPVVHFEGGDAARAVIREDIRNNRISNPT